MNKPGYTLPDFIEQLDCFGDYRKSDPLCAKHCVLRLRCAIEQNQNVRMELLEDLVAAEGMLIKIQ